MSKQKVKGKITNLLHNKVFLLFLFLLLLLMPQLMPKVYYVHIINIIGIYIILSVSLDLLLGTTGLMQLGHAGFYGFGAYLGAIISTSLLVDMAIGFWLGIPIVFLCSMFVGFLVGAPSLRLKGIYFALVTLGFGEMVRSIFLNWVSVTNGPYGIKSIPSPEIFGFNLGSQRISFYWIWLFAFIAMWVVYALRKSKYGRFWRAVREDEIVASTTGVNVYQRKIQSLMVSAGLAGVAGTLFAHYISYINPNNFIMDESILILSMVIIGGRDKLLGAVLGAVLLVFIPEALRFMATYRMLLYGLGLVLMIIFRPEGVMGEDGGK